jgi:hypothetical protein
MFKDSLGYTTKTLISFKNFYKLFLFCKVHLPFIFASKSLLNFYAHIILCEKSVSRLKNVTQLFLNLFFFSKTCRVDSVIVLNGATLYKLQTLYGFLLWDSNGADNYQIHNVFVKPNERKYKFLGQGSEEYLKQRYYTTLIKYRDLGLVFFKKFSFYLNLKPFIKNRVVTNSFLVTPRFSSSSTNKYIDLNNLTEYQFQYLRKNKVYNKGRYSRNRQNYRTGVYMCLYLSVISIFGLYYSFYKFAFKFTYLWWFFIAFVGSFILPKAIKYRLYEPTTLLKKFFDLYVWFCELLKPVFEKINKLL